jgi:hypothetical protein
LAGPVRAVCKPAIGGNAERKRVARDQAVDGFDGGARLILGPAFERVIGLADAAFAEDCESNADRQQDRSEDEEKLGRRRQAREALGERPREISRWLGELADETCEVVGDRFAQGIVVHRPERAPQIASALLARNFVGSVRLF